MLTPIMWLSGILIGTRLMILKYSLLYVGVYFGPVSEGNCPLAR